MNDNDPILIPDPNDEWARVELYRWQYGHLPGCEGIGALPLSEPEGLRAMAKAIEENNPANFPAPFNVISVLRYAAKRIEELEMNVEALCQ